MVRLGSCVPGASGASSAAPLASAVLPCPESWVFPSVWRPGWVRAHRFSLALGRGDIEAEVERRLLFLSRAQLSRVFTLASRLIVSERVVCGASWRKGEVHPTFPLLWLQLSPQRNGKAPMKNNRLSATLTATLPYLVVMACSAAPTEPQMSRDALTVPDKTTAAFDEAPASDSLAAQRGGHMIGSGH